MIKTYVQGLKCGKCNNVIGNRAPVTESNEIKGTYLTICPNCHTSLMTAGNKLISLEDINRDLADKLDQELFNKMINDIQQITEKTGIANSLLTIFGKPELIKTRVADRNGSSSSVETSKDGIQIKVNEGQKEKIHAHQEEKISYATKYVALLDGDVCEEYMEKDGISIKDIYKELIEDYGMAAVLDGKVRLYELKEIRPKFKEKTVYELDM